MLSHGELIEKWERAGLLHGQPTQQGKLNLAIKLETEAKRVHDAKGTVEDFRKILEEMKAQGWFEA